MSRVLKAGQTKPGEAVIVNARLLHDPLAAVDSDGELLEGTGASGSGSSYDDEPQLTDAELRAQEILSLAATQAQQIRSTAQGQAQQALFDEDDAGPGLFGLLEQVTHARSTDPDEHLHKLGGADREERRGLPRLPSLCKKGLAGARRTHQNDALGHPAAQPLEAGRVFEVFSDFAELVHCLASPAYTLSKVTPVCSPVMRCALLLPKEKMPPDAPVPPAAFRMPLSNT